MASLLPTSLSSPPETPAQAGGGRLQALLPSSGVSKGLTGREDLEAEVGVLRAQNARAAFFIASNAAD